VVPQLTHILAELPHAWHAVQSSPSAHSGGLHTADAAPEGVRTFWPAHQHALAALAVNSSWPAGHCCTEGFNSAYSSLAHWRARPHQEPPCLAIARSLGCTSKLCVTHNNMDEAAGCPARQQHASSHTTAYKLST